MLIRTISAAVLFFLAACADATLVSRVYYDHADVIGLFGYAAGDRDFLVEIQGNPTLDPKTTFDGAVISAMRGRHGGPPTEFTTTPSERARTDYRIVMVFGAPQYFGARAACAGKKAEMAQVPSGRIDIQAAFCHKERPLSYARVTFGPISGALDSRLASAVGQATLNLVPRYDPDPKDQNEPFLVP